MSTNARPTLQDVADLANVSTATVSRILNDPDKVGQAARDRVEHAIATLGYTPNFGARALATNQTNTVGAIIPTLSNAMFASGIQAFQEVLAEAGVTLLIATTGYDPKIELRQIRSLVSRGASGLLLIGNDRLDETRKYLATRRTPHVISWCFRDGADQMFVGFDNYAAAYDATRRVLAKGHKRIGIIAGDCTSNDRARARRDGAMAAVAATQDAQVVQVIPAPYRIDAGRQACEEMLRLACPPTALICGNDVLAAGAMIAARNHKLKIPDDISIVGFDDIGLASVVTPAMTTVRVPQIEMGRAAAGLLLDAVAGKPDLTGVRLDTQFIERGSLGPPPKKG
ncbi:MAG: LacI family DNA-binding transcriptional regulator [Yoonia sp.]|nr:LacI family DNA-binding transcriptional regulator [Yoonia sp.]